MKRGVAAGIMKGEAEVITGKERGKSGWRKGGKETGGKQKKTNEGGRGKGKVKRG